MTLKHTLFAFPDSGYHTFFYPVAMGRKVSQNQNFARATSEDWTSPAGKSWLKGRFGLRSVMGTNGKLVEKTGFWVAIDLNTGGLDRGYICPDLIKKSNRRVAKPKRKILIDDLEPSLEQAKLGAYNPYIANDEHTLPDTLTLDIDLEFGLQGKLGKLVLDVIFVEEAGEPVAVNLIVDLGNSRTVVLGLERSKNAEGLGSVCRPILFPKNGADIDEYDADTTDLDDVIPHSWFALMESEFGTQSSRPLTTAVQNNFEDRNLLDRILNITRKNREKTVAIAPHQFTRVSPAIIGHAAEEALSELDTDGGGTSFLSAPKRYIWDDRPLGSEGQTHWTMQTQAWRKNTRGRDDLVPLKGDIFRFMPNAEESFTLEEHAGGINQTLKTQPNHSRADSIIWVALAILEQAHRQIQSEGWRKGNQPYLRRILGNIILTYPAGWTEDEIERLRSKWERALDILMLTQFENPVALKQDGNAPKVHLALDEAVAPQLAIIFAEMHQMRDYGQNWLELYGRGKGENARTRVMTIDIGGGTTDTSIVEYSDSLPGAGVDLTSRLLFKDSNTVAGDMLVKDIIERIILPHLGNTYSAENEERSKFSQLFLNRAQRDSERAQWSVITRTVFVPIAHKWLRNFSNNELINPETGKAWNSEAAGASKVQIEKLNRLAQKCGLSGDILDPKTPLTFDPALMKRVIRDWFTSVAEAHANYVSLFDCDLVILTGKPSELPQIRSLLEEYLPIDPGRIISAKGYFAGDWLPVSRKGEIDDAKLVTAFGTAIFNAVDTGTISNWRIQSDVDQNCRIENYWGRIAGDLKPFQSDDIILPAGLMEGQARLLSESFLGRARFLDHAMPEQVYKLALKSGEKILLDVTFKRTIPNSANQKHTTRASADGLEITSARDAQTGKKISLDQIALELCSMPRAEDYWQDSGRFEVRWSA